MYQMNRNLREEVQIQLYYKFLSKSNFLHQNFSKEFIKSLCFKMKEQTYSPEQDVFVKGKMHNRLITILSGTVQSYVPGKSLSDDILLRDYDEGFIIGEREFFLKETV
jgi:CRP-like cAMP-binding protein